MTIKDRLAKSIAKRKVDMAELRVKIRALESDAADLGRGLVSGISEYRKMQNEINKTEKEQKEMYDMLYGNPNMLVRELPLKSTPYTYTYDPHEIERVSGREDFDYLIMTFTEGVLYKTWGGQGVPYPDATIVEVM